jgi:hypothetical protein
MMQNNEISNKKLQWNCRVLMTVNLLTTLIGYNAFFQTQRQLNSPLIPRNTIFIIFRESGNDVMIASIVSACVFLAGLWLYTFGKLKLATWFFAAGVAGPILLIMSGILPAEFST